MIDSEKVKRMTKVAIYENGQGKKDLKMYQWKQETYTGLKILESLICMTFAYCCVAGLYSIQYINLILERGISAFKSKGILLVIIYLIVMAVTWIYSYYYYKRKYREARKRVVCYDKDLYNLESYIKEKTMK